MLDRTTASGGVPKHAIPGFISLLTDRDLENLTWIASGKTARWLGEEHGLSRGGMRTASARLYGKLGATDYEVDARIQCTKLYWQWKLQDHA